MDRDCLGRALARDEEGLVDCVYSEVLYSGAHCDDVPGRSRIGETTLGPGEVVEVCRVEQLRVTDGVEPTGAGWYYDDFSERALQTCDEYPQRLGFTEAGQPSPETARRFDCAFTGYRDSWCIGSPCPAPGVGCTRDEVIGTRRCPYDFICDPETNTLQEPCTEDYDCTSTGYCGADGRCTSYECWELERSALP
ncbi:MAG: hypothetical protein JRH11_21345 [Deltaproteobacteria bacterium]|nr:hypothetical protein [Deltaproteobacteria bacterium]